MYYRKYLVYYRKCLVYYKKRSHTVQVIILPQYLDPNFRPNVNDLIIMILKWATTTEHAGERGEQLSVDAEMQPYGDRAVAASNQFYCKSRWEPSR